MGCLVTMNVKADFLLVSLISATIIGLANATLPFNL
jgi:hypothetical protein